MAVHLVRQTTDGHFGVQKRTFNKPNDPGKWNTIDGMLPNKQDGEVVQVVLMDDAQLLAATQRGEFTLEAELIFAPVLNLVDQR